MHAGWEIGYAVVTATNIAPKLTAVTQLLYIREHKH